MSDRTPAGRPPPEGDLFRLLVENVRDYAIFVVGADGRVRTWGPAAERLLGYREAEILGRPAELFFTPEDVARGVPRQELEQALATGRGEDDRWHVRKDGTRFWSSGVTTPLRDEGGALRGFAKIMRDLTEWKRAELARQEAELRRAAILETALDAIVTIDHEGRVLDFNPAAERLFGRARADALGREIAGLIVPPRLREAHRRGLAHYLATGEGPVLGRRVEMPALRADGSEVPVELAITRVPTDGPPQFTAYLRDLSERSRADSRRGARLAVTQALAEAAMAQEAVPRVLQAVGEALGWDAGAFWAPAGDVLRCLDFWHAPAVPVREFEAMTRALALPPGVGLPGRVWQSGAAARVPDVTRDANFPRAAVAAREGLHGAFAFPVRVGDALLGVIEFFSRELREPDADLLEMMATVGGQVGQFLERQRAEEAVRDSERRFARFMRHLPGLAWLKDAQGRYVYANDAAVAAFGVPREGLYGRTDEEVFPPETAARFRENDRQALAGPGGAQVIESLAHPDGTVRHSLVSKFPIPGPAGAAGLVGGVAIDVTDRLRAEEALRQSEAQMRLVTDHAPVLIAHCGRDHRFKFVNKPYAARFGLRPEEVVGRPIAEVTGEEAYESFRPYADRALAGEEVAFDVEVPYRGLGPRYMRCAYAPERGPSGAVEGWVAVLADVTDRHEAEARARAEEQRFRALAGQAPVGIFQTDAEGNCLFVNEKWRALAGLSPEAAAGRGWADALHPDDRDRVFREWYAAAAAGREFAAEYRFRTPAGVVSWVEGRAVALRGEAGEVTGHIGTVTDITERRRVEQALRLLADASATLAAVVDYESTLRKVAGLAVPHFADWCAVDLAGPGGTTRLLAAVHSDPEKVRLAHELRARYPPEPDAPRGVPLVLRTGEPDVMADVSDELIARSARDEGHLRLLREVGLRSYMCVPLRARGQLLGALTFVSAESGRRYSEADLAFAEELARRAGIALENAQLYAELREADRRKDEFLATLAHELRNPMAPLRNGLHLLREAREPDARERARAMMERQLGQLVRLVDDLLDVSRITRGKLELRKARVELRAVVENAVETARPQVEAGRHHLAVSLPAEPVWLDADLTRLAQVFANLLNNAAKYTPPGGRIELGASVEGDKVTRWQGDKVTEDSGGASPVTLSPSVVVSVRDTGIGIPAEALPRLFEMFSQVDQSLERAQGGLGIGLALVKGLTEMHGGRVEARSDGPGRGSTFVVRLPVAARPPEAPAPEARSAAGPRRRVLVADDNRDGAASLAMMLEFWGHEVRTAYDGAEAVEVAEAFRPEVIVLDLGMPRLNGYDACRRIRERPWGKGALIVAATGWGQESDRQRSREAGFDHHLVKPVPLAALQGLLAGPARTA